MHYHAHAWGGTPAHEYEGGEPARSALAPSTAQLIVSSWDEEPVIDEPQVLDPKFCQAIAKKTDQQCQAYKKTGEDFCNFHLKRSVDNGADA